MSQALQEPQVAVLDFPEAFADLFVPARYKVWYGGRGGAKSWAFARALLIQGLQRPLRVLCAREIQKSMKDSVHKLLADQIIAMGMQSAYQVQHESIIGTNGTSFAFAGLAHNISNIKSKEGVDVVWVEEAESTSGTSWETLIPTIRKEGSEIWVSFNPDLATSETYKRFVLRPPANSIVRKVSWRDNPWFPKVLIEEMEDLKARNFKEYLVVWEGHCRTMLEGAVFAEEITDATAAGRFRKVPYTPFIPVDTYWDLGYGDATAIWMIQKVGLEYRAIDFLSARQKKLPWYLGELKKRQWESPDGRRHPYQWGVDWLPHDARKNQLGTGMTVQEEMWAAGRRVQITPNIRLVDGINAARTIFPLVWFDAEKTAEGTDLLGKYRFDIDPKTKLFSKNPLHDESSHAADAFRYFAVANRTPIRQRSKGRSTFMSR